MKVKLDLIMNNISEKYKKHVKVAVITPFYGILFEFGISKAGQQEDTEGSWSQLQVQAQR